MKGMKKVEQCAGFLGCLILGFSLPVSGEVPAVAPQGTVDPAAQIQWRDWVPDGAWVSMLERLSGGPPPETVIGRPEIIAGMDRGRLVCLSYGLRGSNWFSGLGGRWLLEENGTETAIAGPDWSRIECVTDPAGQGVTEIWRRDGTGDEIRLTWQLDAGASALDCMAEGVNGSCPVRLIWEAELSPEAPFPAAWSGVFRGGMKMVWMPVPKVSDTFIAAAAWLPDAADSCRWAELDSLTLNDLKQYLRTDRFDREIPGKVLGWRIGGGGEQRMLPVGTGFGNWFRGGKWRMRVTFSPGTAGFIRYTVGGDPSEVLRACMVRQTDTAVLDASAGGKRSSGEGSPQDLLEMATDPVAGITVLHPGAGHFFRVTRPAWAWVAAQEWLRRQRPDRAIAQLDPFLNRFSGGFVPGVVPLNAPALVNVAGEPVLPRIFDSFGDTAVTVLTATDLLNDMPPSAGSEVRARWLICLEQAVWSLYWQSDPLDGTPPPVFHPGRSERIVAETDWITALTVLGAMERMYRDQNRVIPSEWRAWRGTLETKLRFRLREEGEKYAWPVRPVVALQLYRHPDQLNLPDRMRFNAAGSVFPQRLIRAVVPDIPEVMRVEEFSSRETTFSPLFRGTICRN